MLGGIFAGDAFGWEMGGFGADTGSGAHRDLVVGFILGSTAGVKNDGGDAVEAA